MGDAVEIVESETVRILFEGSKCIHSRNCVLSRPDVFVPNVEGAWIHPERASTEEIVELAHLCPSGAIRFERKDGGSPEAPPKVNLARLRENGPLAFHAEIALSGTTGAVRLTLCRCGASRNKPYCDGSHAAANFTASGEAPVQPSAASTPDIRNGALRIGAAPNGPLLTNGPLEIVSGTGKTLAKTTNAALCRCGHSTNKPFCDGAHAAAKFEAPAI